MRDFAMGIPKTKKWIKNKINIESLKYTSHVKESFMFFSAMFFFFSYVSVCGKIFYVSSGKTNASKLN